MGPTPESQRSPLEPVWEQLDVPVDDDAEPQDAQPMDCHGAEEEDG